MYSKEVGKELDTMPCCCCGCSRCCSCCCRSDDKGDGEYRRLLLSGASFGDERSHASCMSSISPPPRPAKGDDVEDGLAEPLATILLPCWTENGPSTSTHPETSLLLPKSPIVDDPIVAVSSTFISVVEVGLDGDGATT